MIGGPPSGHWPTPRRDLVSPLSGSRFFRASRRRAALGALQKGQIEKWWPLIKRFGIKAE